MKSWLRLLLAIGIALLTPLAWSAESPGSSRFSLSWWGVAEGLPGNDVKAVAQDSNGFLWLATLTGLVRFDGSSFVTFDEVSAGLPNGRFTAVHAGPDKRIWAAAQGVLVRVDEQGIRAVATDPEQRWINAIAEDVNGDVWVAFTPLGGVAVSAPLAVLRGHELVPVAVPDGVVASRRATSDRDRSIPGGNLPLGYEEPLVGLDRDTEGAVRSFVAFGDSGQPARDEWLQREPGNPAVLPFGVGELVVDPETTSRDGRVSIRQRGSALRYQVPIGSNDLLAAWHVDAKDRLWISRHRVLEVYLPDDEVPLSRWALGSEVNDLIEDREGNIWVATSTRGLLRIRPAVLREQAPGDGLPLADWLETTPDGFAWLAPLTTFSPEARLPDQCGRHFVLHYARPPETRVRCSTRVADQQGLPVVMSAMPGFGDPATTFDEGIRIGEWLGLDPLDPDVAWVGGDLGLIRLVKGHVKADAQWWFKASTAPFVDANGARWFGSTAGLLRIEGDRWQVFSRDDGLPVEDVRGIIRAGDGGLWIGTYGGGLVHFDGRRFKAVTIEDGLHENIVSSLVRDGHGAIWTAGNRGIQRVLESDLEALLAGAVQRIPAMLLDQSAGLSNPETSGPRSAVKDVDGILWFSTFGGIVSADPVVIAERETQPVVPLLLRAGQPWPRTEGTIELAPRSRRLDLAFTAIHLSAPETLRFRYRLGSGPWIDAGADRSMDALPINDPGTFPLSLQVRHSGGPWTGLAKPVTVEVLPRYFETVWFRSLVLIAFVLLLLATWQIGSLRNRRRAQALEAVVQKRTAELAAERDRVSRQAEKLHGLAEGRAHFISGISHELRTPLTLILGPLQELHRRLDQVLGGTDREQLAHARQNAEWMLGLVERLLETARYDSELLPLTVREHDLAALLRELTDQLESAYEAHESTLVLDAPDAPQLIWFDPLLIRSALLNLLVNPLRHCPNGTRVTCRLITESDIARVQVVDDGPGIPEAEQAHLFERFYRAGAGRSDTGKSGYGLGLWMVRQVAERHHGHVAVDSSSAGTCFTLVLSADRGRFAPEDFADRAQPTRHTQAADKTIPIDTMSGEDLADSETGPSVLVIDDNPGIRRFIRHCLSERFRIAEAGDGREGLSRARELLPDIIISDVMMPNMDGLAFSAALRSDPETDFLALILLTAQAGTDNRVEGLQRGADAYLTKPFDRRELEATIDSILDGRRRLRRRIEAEREHEGSTASVIQALLDSAPAAGKELLARAEAMINAHLGDEDLAIEQVGDALHLSRATLYRKLKDACGLTPAELIREVRLQHAARMLQAGEYSVSEIGYAVGFRSVSHFSNAVLERFGERPSAIRSRHR